MRAKTICSESKCLNIVTSGGKCKDHGRKPWNNISKRNLTRPTDWNSRRNFVRRRDKGKCVKCGSTDSVEVDHRLPVAFGGSWEYSNLWLLCEPCHAGKTLRDVTIRK